MGGPRCNPISHRARRGGHFGHRRRPFRQLSVGGGPQGGAAVARRRRRLPPALADAAHADSARPAGGWRRTSGCGWDPGRLRGPGGEQRDARRREPRGRRWDDWPRGRPPPRAHRRPQRGPHLAGRPAKALRDRALDRGAGRGEAGGGERRGGGVGAAREEQVEDGHGLRLRDGVGCVGHAAGRRYALSLPPSPPTPLSCAAAAARCSGVAPSTASRWLTGTRRTSRR